MQSNSPKNQQAFPSSPPWNRNTKLFVFGWVSVFAVAVVLFFNQIFMSIVLALVVSLVLRPLVDAIYERIPRVPRILVTALIYLLIFGGLVAFPVSAIPGLWQQVLSFVSSLPELLQLLVDQITVAFSEPIVIFGESYTFPVDEIAISAYEQTLSDLVALSTSAVSSVGELAGTVATSTIVFFSRVLFILFISFYLTKDEGVIANSVLRLAPEGYRNDVAYLMERVGLIWGAFLRGQFILMLIIGTLVFIIATILGLPNAVALGVIAGVMELVPFVGPVLAAIPAGLIAFFQSDASWLGSLLTPFWFFVIVMGVYWFVQQIENYLVLPRVMGHQLKLHPAVVFVAAVAGFQLAGIVGVFVAAPTVATVRILLRFIFGKLLDVSDPVATPVIAPVEPSEIPSILPDARARIAKAWDNVRASEETKSGDLPQETTT